MATYQQYSEVVAAYGYTAPPPAQPQANRLGVALLYAAIGVALGTMTGTGMAAVSMQPGGVVGWAHRLNLPNFSSPAKSAHVAAHAQTAPVVSHATPAPAPAVQVALKQSAPAAPVSTQAKAAAPIQAKAVNPIQAKATAPTQARATAPAPVAHASLLSRVLPSSVVEASVDTAAVRRVPTVHHEAAPVRMKLAPAVRSQAAVAVPVVSAPTPAAPPVRLASLRMPTALPVPTVVQVSLDEQVNQAVFYSEGDTTVVDYDATLDTILTNDGRTFVVGPTVSMSSASSWNDYRSNVHYRCDQAGKCTITRNGVIALNAKLI